MDKVLITFPEQVNTRTFEKILSQYLTETKSKKTQAVTFDFSKVQWCDLFELSLLIIWIDDLKERFKYIEFIYPLCEAAASETRLLKQNNVLKRRNVCSYLNRWDFDVFLRSRSVEIIGHEQNYPYWPAEPEQDSILPVRLFEGERDFKAFISNLEDGNQFELLFKDTLSLSVIGNGGIRDTIMNEIGQNIYDHAKGRCGFVTIGTIPPLEHTNSASARYSLSSVLEKNFFRSLGKSGYLQLVIADRGPGIANRYFKSVYMDDPRVSASDKQNPLESKIIDYAFEFDTTSKSKDLLGFLEEEDPGRGLYWVREIVLKNKGLLSVRSGASIIRYDFLNSQDKHSYKSNSDDSELKNLARLGGTQIKIYFPLNPELTIQQQVQHAFHPSSIITVPALQSSYEIIEVHNYFIDGSWSSESTSRLLNDFPKGPRTQPALRIVILDFANTTWGKDELFPLLVNLAKMQHDGLIVVGCNTEHIPQIFDIASDVLAQRIQQHPIKLKPILFIRDSGFEVIGLPAADRDTLDSVSTAGERKNSTKSYTRSAYEDFASRYDNLFWVDVNSGELNLKLDVQDIRSRVVQYYIDSLARIILDEGNGIFHPGQFVIPSNIYVEGYFRINTLLTYAEYYRRVLFILLNSLLTLDVPPDCVLTFSNDLTELGEEIAHRLSSIHNRNIEHVNLKNARDKSSTARVALTRLNSKRLVILNSVIGTAVSLESVLDVFQEPNFHISVQKILTIVDARPKEKIKGGETEVAQEHYEYRGNIYGLESILSNPLRFHNTKPAYWRNENIRRIDPKTNAPDPVRPQPATEPLWHPADGFFLNNIVRNAKALKIDHYTRRRRHYIYFFDMVKIADSVGPEIADKIEKDISDLPEDSQITYVLYDEASRGAENVAGNISLKFPHSQSCSVQSFMKTRNLIRSSVEGKDVIIYVNSVASGTKLQQLIYQVAEHDPKPRRIFSYAVIHRRESDSVPFYQRIDLFSGVELRTRYFVELELPAHSVWDCPACNYRVLLRELRESFSDDTTLAAFLDEEIEALKSTSVEIESELHASSDTEAEESISQAILRRQLGEGKTVLQARFPIKDTVKDYLQDKANLLYVDQVLRLLEVIAKEVLLFKTYDELFYPELRNHFAEACIALLQNPADEYQRERAAIIVLGHLKPDSLVDNLIPILKGTAQNITFLYYLFIELMRLIKEAGEDQEHRPQLSRIATALELCQEAVEDDTPFTTLSVEKVTALQHLLNYTRRRLRIDIYRDRATQASWEAAVATLWTAFVNQPGHVHPKLIQGFSHVLDIMDVESFRHIYKTFYAGEGNFAQTVEEVIPLFDIFATRLRPNIRKNLLYFLSTGKGTFSDDYKLLDDSLSALATLDSQQRLSEEDVDTIFWKNPEVRSAKERLNNYAFKEDSSLIRNTLIEKFSDVTEVIEDTLRAWRKRFEEVGIEIQTSFRQSEVFAPPTVLKDVLDNLLKNVYEHAFDPDSKLKVINLSVDHQIEQVMIMIGDTGRGISPEDIKNRPAGGFKKSEKLLGLYGGNIKIIPREQVDLQELNTVVVITLRSKEVILSWRSV